jgi:hypothetical protein
MPYMMAARPRIWGAERVEDVRAPNMRPVGSNRQAYQKTICTWIPNGYGDLRRRRLYIRLITIHACTELRRCKRSGVLRDAASSRSQCPHIYSTTQSASATAYAWRFAPISHARFFLRGRARRLTGSVHNDNGVRNPTSTRSVGTRLRLRLGFAFLFGQKKHTNTDTHAHTHTQGRPSAPCIF